MSKANFGLPLNAKGFKREKDHEDPLRDQHRHRPTQTLEQGQAYRTETTAAAEARLSFRLLRVRSTVDGSATATTRPGRCLDYLPLGRFTTRADERSECRPTQVMKRPCGSPPRLKRRFGCSTAPFKRSL